MAYVRTGLSGLGVDPATAAVVAKVAPVIISAAKRMMGPFGFPKIHEFLDQVARERGPEVVAAVYQAIPALARSRESVEPVPAMGPSLPVSPSVELPGETTPIVAAGFAPDLGGATVPLLIAAGLGLMLFLKGR